MHPLAGAGRIGTYRYGRQLGHLDGLASRAEQAVDVTIDPAMLKLAGAFLSDDKEQAALKDVLAGITGIYVRSFEFGQENAYTPDDVTAIRRQFADERWARLVAVDSKRDRELVEVYSWREGEQSGGMAILVAEPRELTVVNIVGLIDFEKLRALQGQFGIPSIPGPQPHAGTAAR